MTLVSGRSVQITTSKPAPDMFGVRPMFLYSISYQHKEAPREIHASFLIAAASEKECQWYLEQWWVRDMMGYNNDFDNMYFEQYQANGFDRCVGAPPDTYNVVVNIIAAGTLDRRGILFKAYTW